MKRIRDKILVIMISAVTVSVLVVGLIGIWQNYSATMATLRDLMKVTAGIAADRVEQELQASLNVVTEAGHMDSLADPSIGVNEKQKLIEQSMSVSNFSKGDILDTKGISIFDRKDYSDKEYFQQALQGKAVAAQAADGELYLVMAAPLWENGVPDSRIIGVVCFTSREGFLCDIAGSINVNENGKAYILDKEGYTIAHSNTSNVTGRENTTRDAQKDPSLQPLAELEQKMVNGESGAGEYDYDGVRKVMAYAPVPGTDGWSIAVNAPKIDFMNATYTGIFIIAVLVVVALIAAFFLALFLANGIGRPIRICADRLNRLAQGDLESEVEEILAKDETGQLSDATKRIVESLKGLVLDLSNGLTALASGNLDLKIEKNELYIGDFQPIAVAINEILNKLNSTMHQINIASEQVASGASQVADGAQVLSRGATEQASSVEELAATINDISRYSTNTAASTLDADKQVQIAGSRVQACDRQMKDMLSAMEEIRSKSVEISKIIKTIEDIAFQTNILALNAAVEAARAGTAGKGFAVVADEVRNLASKSAEASKNTAALIAGTVQAVEKGFGYANETAGSLVEIVDVAKSVSVTVGKISEDAKEQANAISQVTTGIEQISGVVQSNSATAEESAAASEELSGQAQMLKSLVGKFKLRSM